MSSFVKTYRFVLACWCVAAVVLAPAAAQPLDLILPTHNDALLRDDGPSFYQYTDRYFQGVRSRPWQGGQYGYVRNPKDTPAGIVYTRLHEGVDIQALNRDARGEPLDDVRAIDEGKVVYVNANPRRSTYGNYVVVEHWWDAAPFYSLYAHLGRVDVKAGQEVEQGTTLGRIGYTGRGLNQRRAHLHFEINMMLSSRFAEWYDDNYRPGTNRHGVFNGINLRGIDVAALYQALHRDPTLTIGRFLTELQAPFYTVAVAREGALGLVERYPWLLRSGPTPLDGGWTIEFTRAGVPVGVRPLRETPASSTVGFAGEPQFGCSTLTMGVLRDDETGCTLSSRGSRFIDLLLSDRVEPQPEAVERVPTRQAVLPPVAPVQDAPRTSW